MKKQTKQLVTLGVLIVAWAISWRVNRLPPTPPYVIKEKAAKSAQQDNLLKMRFHKVRAEMDGLYHYRIKPSPFDSRENPFRIPAFMEEALAARAESLRPVKPVVIEQQANDTPPDSGELLLRHAIDAIRLGGVVTLDDASQLNVNGELHKQGDVFTATVKGRLVLIRIKRLTTAYVILALDDPAAGNAEARVRLN